jgi:hypothetical protein
LVEKIRSPHFVRNGFLEKKKGKEQMEKSQKKLEGNSLRSKAVMGIFLIFLLTTLPVAFAVSVNPDSIVVDVSDTTAAISWETDTAATGAINYGTSTSSLTQIPSTAGEATTHDATLEDLKAGENYYYNIEATDSDGTYTSTYMNFTTLLSAPENLEAENDNNIVTLTWDDVDDARLYYIFQDGTYADIASTEEYETSELSYTTTYTYYVTAVDQYGLQSDPSNEVTIEIGEEPVNITFVQTTSVTKTTATISWQTDREANSTVRYGTKEENLNLSITDADETTEHELIIKELEEETTYYFTVISASTEYDDIEAFSTLGDGTAVEIDNIEVSDITRSTAEISWTTNVETRGSIYYSTDDSFTQYVKEDSDEVTHHEEIEELLSGTTYYFKIIADDTESEIQNLTTSESLYDFIDMEEVPEMWNDLSLTLKGTTAENAKVYIFVNRDSNPYAQVMMDINGTYFEANVTFNPYSYVDDVKGRNIVEIHSWDEDNNKALREYTIDVDTASPALSVNDFSAWTNQDEINVSGYTESDTTVTIYIDEKKKTSFYVSEEDGYFEAVVDVGTATKSHNMSVEAMDAAGNSATFIKEIHVDRQDPKLTFLTRFTESTHYKLFRVDGQTEANATIMVTNFGEYSGCEDINFQSKYGDCEYLANTYGNGPHQTLDMLLDPTALMLDLLDLAIGVPTTTVADDEGNFSIIVALQAGSTNTEWADSSTSSVNDASIKAAKNTLVFNVTDLAGNKYDTKKQIKYQPSCADWTIAKTTTFPMNIYTQDLTGGDIMGSALFEIQYMGIGTPEVSKITVQEDDSGGQQLIKEGEVEMGTAQSVYYKQSYGGLENSNEYISIYAQEIKHTEYDNGHVYLYAPVNINEYNGNVEELPEQFGVYLDAYISYTDGTGQVSSCHLYPAVAYDVQKPETISKWLSPTMINQSIQALDQMINFTESAVHYLTVASRWTLVGCGGMIAWNYAKGFAGSSVSGDNACNEDLEKVYAVCDRILCPPIGANCADFESSGLYKFGDKQDCSATNEQCRIDYQNAAKSNEAIQDELSGEYQTWKESGHEDDSFNDFYEKGQVDPTTSTAQAIASAGDYDTGLEHPYEYTIDDPGTGDTVTIQYLNPDDPTASGTVGSTYAAAFADCGPDTKSLVRVTGLESDETSLLNLESYGKKVHTKEGVNYYCSDVPKEQIGEPDKGLVPGCWSDECPSFDNTKCMFGKGYNINPAEGLFGSLQCGCLTGAKGHLENYLKIMMGAKKCLQQVLLGDQTAGYCERLMSYFVCDILTEVFKHMFRSLNQGVGPLAAIYGPDQVESYQENAQSINKGLSSRYGDIVKNNQAFSTNNLINKACIAAFTADWSVLEGVLDTMVDNIYVAPIATISGSSRPYGYDPFSGRITMAYNVYVGVFPGGPTKVEAWLECDKGMPGHDFCADGDNSKIDLVYEGKVYPYMDEDDYFDENIVVFDNNGLSIYNKATLVLTYEVGGKEETEVYKAQLYPKGDITAFGCVFSSSQGFQCSMGLEFMDLAHGAGGTVQLYSDQQGSTLSPEVTQYYGDNQVAAVVKVKNSYAETFYLRVDNSVDEFEYWAVGGTDSGDYYGLQYYLLWLDSSGSGTSGTKSLDKVTDKITLTQGATNMDVTQGVTGLWFTLPTTTTDDLILDKVTLKLAPMEDDDSKLIGVECTIENAVSASHTLNGKRYYECLGGSTDTNDYQLEGTTSATSTPRAFTDIEYISGLKFVSPSEATTDALNVGDTLRFYMLNAASDGNDYIETEYSSTGSSSTKSRTASINVLADVDDDGHGESKIYSPDQDPKDQEFSLKYSIGNTPSSSSKSRPVVHFIQPTPILDSDSAYVNSDSKPVPIGFTIFDDDNNLGTISIGIVGSNNWQCLAKFGYDASTNDFTSESGTVDVNGYPCGLRRGSRHIGFQEGKPPFFEFDLEVDGDEDQVYIDNDAFYDITLHVEDVDGNPSEDRIRRIRFSETSDDVYEDMLICLGSGGCSKWEGPDDDVQAISGTSAQEKEEEEDEETENSLDSDEPELKGLSG